MMRSARFRAAPSELVKLEDFIDSIPFLEGDERSRLLIVASEILDNIISYSLDLRCSAVTVRVSKSRALTLIFFFKSSNFSLFAATERESERRYFDKSINRYRGLGLTMCRNLSRSMRFRPGREIDSVIITF